MSPINWLGSEEEKPEVKTPFEEKPAGPKVRMLDQLYDELRNDPDINQEPVYGENMKQALGEYMSSWDAYHEGRIDKAKMDAVWRRTVDALNTTPFLVPFDYGDDVPGTVDKTLHTTPAAARKLNREAIFFRCHRMVNGLLSTHAWVCDEKGEPSVDVNWWDISRFSGSEGYSFAPGGDPRHGPMLFYTKRDANNIYFGLYTDIPYVTAQFSNNTCPHITVITVGDMLNYLRRDPNLAGILINPDTPTHCFIPKEQLGIRNP